MRVDGGVLYHYLVARLDARWRRRYALHEHTLPCGRDCKRTMTVAWRRRVGSYDVKLPADAPREDGYALELVAPGLVNAGLEKEYISFHGMIV